MKSSFYRSITYIFIPVVLCFSCLTVVAQTASINSNKFQFKSEYIFPFQNLHVHSSSIVELPDGDLFACWFEGSGERTANDVVIKGARLKKGESKWSKPFILADTPGHPDCNPTLFIDNENRLHLFWIVVQANRWESSILKTRISSNYQKNGIPKWEWQDVILLKPGEEFAETIKNKFRESSVPELAWAEYAPLYEKMIYDAARDPKKRETGWMTRTHPLQLPDGRILLPLYSDGFNFSIIAISDDQGETWLPGLPIVGRGNVQPSLVLKKNGDLVAYMRDNGDEPGRVMKSISKDNGFEWSITEDTRIPNPGTSVEAISLENGDWIMVYNDIENGRHSLAVSLSDDEGETWRWTRNLEKEKAGEGSFSYPSVIQTKDGLIHATYSFHQKNNKTIKHVAFSSDWVAGVGCTDNPFPQKQFTHDIDGMLVIDGKRTFIIGSYHHPKTNRPFEELAKHGYNYTRIDADPAALDSAQAHHVMTWIVTGSIQPGNEHEDRERIAQLVNGFKNHPSLLCWEMEDEPAFTWNSAEPRIKPELLIETYQLIKQEDPDHLVITNHGPVNLVSTLASYNRSTDIVACDVYPVIPHGIKPTYALYPDGLQGDLLTPYISQVGEYTDKMKRVVENSRPVFMVLQAFSWEMLKKEEERDTTMILYPSYKESRFMAYNAIVHGATGILYWGSNYTPQPSLFMDDLNKVTRELAGMQEILSATNAELNITKEYHELRYSIDTGIEILTKNVNDKYYLISVNSDKNPVKVSLTGLDKYKNANVLNENRTVPIEKGKLTDCFEPFEIHVYELNN